MTKSYINGEPNEQRLLGECLLLFRTSALGGRRGHMEAFGWLAVDGAYMYPNTAPTPSQVSAFRVQLCYEICSRRA